MAAAPLLAAMSVMAAGRRHGVRETMAVARAYGAARAKYGSDLLEALLETSPAGAMKRPGNRTDLDQAAPEALEEATAVLARRASAEERAEYRRFVVELVGAAASTRGRGGLLRRARRADAGPDEQRALDRITAILDRATHADAER